LLLLLLLVILRFALGFGQLTIFHIKQQVFSLQLRNEVQYQSQNEKTGLRGVFSVHFEPRFEPAIGRLVV
jgi:hypothetical protein